MYCILAAVIHLGDVEIEADDSMRHHGEQSCIQSTDTINTGLYTSCFSQSYLLSEVQTVILARNEAECSAFQILFWQLQTCD